MNFVIVLEGKNPSYNQSNLFPGRNFDPSGEISLYYMDWLMMDYFSPTFSEL